MAKRASRSPRIKNEATESLIQAVSFISHCQEKDGSILETHCRILQGFIYASNGVISMGSPIQADLHLCPNTYALKAALERCEGPLSMTMEGDRLSIKAGPFRAVVPCVDGQSVALIRADAAQVPVNDRLRSAMETVGILASDTADDLIGATVLLRSGTAVGTDRHIVLEAWHGFNMPPAMTIPKRFVSILSKIKEPLAAFGYGGGSVTIYFESGRWVRTQLYNEPWPIEQLDKIFSSHIHLRDVPEGLFEAFDKVAPFCHVEDNFVYIIPTGVQSHLSDKLGAQYELEIAAKLYAVNPDLLSIVRPFIKQIDLTTYIDKLFFVGDGIRGAVMGKMPPRESSDLDKEIPF